MTAALVELPIRTPNPETLGRCGDCPTLQRLEQELEALRREVRELRCEAGYWKSRHADALKRIEKLEAELEQSRGQTRALQDKLFGRKSEKSACNDRSNDLSDPEGVAAPAKRRGAQPGHAGHGRRDDSHLPVEEEFLPLPAAMLARNRLGGFHQADETRWLVFVLLDGKKGYGWWLWVMLGADTVIYVLDPSRSHEVPEAHFGPDASGVLEVDRYSGYKAMAQVKSGLIVLAFCWAHVRRDFVGVGKGWQELAPWALCWLRRIRELYRLNRERLRHPRGSAEFQEQDGLLRRAVEAMRAEAARELSDPKLRQPCRKVLESLQEHWEGLTRFVDDPRIPMDNNASERAGRGPAVARKNFYGSGSLWSGRLAAAMFSLLATLAHWKLNPRRWLTWYLESCAAAGGKTPDDIESFLPWNLSAERRAALAMRSTTPVAPDTS